jgi:hypothetical protein
MSGVQALTGTHPEMYEGEVRDVVWRRVLDAGDACEHLELHEAVLWPAGCMWCGRRGAGSLERTSPILKCSRRGTLAWAMRRLPGDITVVAFLTSRLGQALRRLRARGVLETGHDGNPVVVVHECVVADQRWRAPSRRTCLHSRRVAAGLGAHDILPTLRVDTMCPCCAWSCGAASRRSPQ